MTHRDITSIAAGVGLFAGADSFTHIYDLARFLHSPVLSAALLPLAGDGMVVVTSRVKSIAARQNVTVPFKITAGFWFGIVATLFANAASGLPGSPWLAILSLWPVASYFVCVETLVFARQHLSVHPVPAVSPVASVIPDASEIPEPDADAPEALEPDAPETPLPLPDAPRPPSPDELSGHRKRKEVRLAELLTAAELKYASDLSAGKLPTYRGIQDDLGCGQAYVKPILTHLKTLRGVSSQHA